ncbi:MAG: hypothetical protein SAL70_30615, partial [Scytonema sp. PMC 1070.18]|nr:hypothetical protein [Scytonema sp. PMC 1070.18]
PSRPSEFHRPARQSSTVPPVRVPPSHPIEIIEVEIISSLGMGSIKIQTGKDARTTRESKKLIFNARAKI